jgi:hypothetical protein
MWILENDWRIRMRLKAHHVVEFVVAITKFLIAIAIYGWLLGRAEVELDRANERPVFMFECPVIPPGPTPRGGR